MVCLLILSDWKHGVTLIEPFLYVFSKMQTEVKSNKPETIVSLPMVWTGHLYNGELQQCWWHSKNACFNSNSWIEAHDCGPRAFCDLHLFFHLLQFVPYQTFTHYFSLSHSTWLHNNCTPLASFLLPQFCPSCLKASLKSRFIAGDSSL